MISGGCACGRIRFRVALKKLDDVGICHCTACRKTTGATHVTWATIPKAAFSWTKGKPGVFRSSHHGRRFLCGTCGTQMVFVTTMDPGNLDITITALDHADRFPPTYHTWTMSKLKWVKLDDGLKRERKERPIHATPRATPRGRTKR